MNTIDPGEANAALSEIERRRSEVIDQSLVPAWYWWAVGLPMVGLGVIVDTRNALAITSAAVIFALGVALLTAWIIFGGLRHVKVHETLLGPRGAGLIVAFVGILVVGTIGLAFVLEATDVPDPATIATIACAIALVLGGPALMRALRDLMRRQAGVG
jgi:hypothetical protein